MKTSIIFLTMLVIILFASNANAQTMLDNNKISVNVNHEKLAIELKRLKDQDNPASTEQMNSLYRQTGNVLSLAGEVRPLDPGTTEEWDSPLVNAVKMYNGSVILGNATATMFRDSAKGTIVNVIGVQGPVNGPDTLKIYKSRDNGISWILVDKRDTEIDGSHVFKINTDEIDCEIVENATGGKYLYVIFGGKDILNGNIKRIGLYRTNFFGVSVYGYLSFPGTSLLPGIRIYKPRMCSDNHQFASAPYIYIIVGVDSVTQTERPSYNRMAVITEPYNMISPSIAYKSGYVGHYNPNQNNLTFEREADIAYIRKGQTDSVLICQSSTLPDSSKLVFYKYWIMPPYNFQSVHDINGISLGNTNPKASIRMATSSADNGVIFISLREKNNGIWRPRYIRNNYYGNFYSASYYTASQYFGSATGYVSPPSVYGLRGSSSFYFAYTVLHEGDYQLYHQKVNGVTGSQLSSSIINPLNISVSTLLTPVTGVRLVSNDSCYTVWSELGPTNVWASLGCTGAVIQGITPQNNGVPGKYSLEQNYPNPFNPVTNIKFSIPRSGHVMIAAYDITGKEATVLVNEPMNAGTYKVDFDASHLSSGVYFYRITAGEYSDVKKMVLVK